MSLHDNCHDKGMGAPTNYIVSEYDICKEYVVNGYKYYG
jgi:hypothetical protein